MKKLILPLALYLLSMTHSYAYQEFQYATHAIYGNDDRYDVVDYPNPLYREMAKSVAGMVSENALYKLQNDVLNSDDFSYLFRGTTLAQAIHACPWEPFREQVVLPICTGFLVAPDTLVTAGHCVPNKAACKNNLWVFDYYKNTTEINGNNVYRCKELIGKRLTYGIITTRDYAIIKLDRVAQNRTPLKFRKHDSISKDTQVFTIGHPVGLPMKIADNGTVHHTSTNTFKTDLDTYTGNSGSPVFNQSTNLVEGILIQGDKDFVISNYLAPNGRDFLDCRESARYRDGTGRKDSNERVFKITKIKEL